MVLLMVLLAGVIATYLLFFLFQFILVGFNLEALAKSTLHLTEDLAQVQRLQILQSFCIFILPPIWLSYLYKSNPSTLLSLSIWDTKKVLMGMLSILFLIPLLNVLIAWNEGIHLPESMKGMEEWIRMKEDAAAQITTLMMSGTTLKDLLMNLLMVAVLAGIGEELFFRGLLLKIVIDALKPKKKLSTNQRYIHLAIWIVAILFSSIHMQFFGFVPRLLLGAWFGYLLWWTGSIWVPILAHFMNNALSTVAMWADHKGFDQKEIDTLGMGNTWWLSIFSLIALYLMVRYFSKKPTIQLRKATSSDVKTIHKLARNTWFSTYKELLSQDQMDYMFDWMYSESSLLEQIEHKGHVFFIAYEGAKPMGYLSIEKQSETLFHLHKIYILPSAQGKGVGKRLLLHAFDYAKENTSAPTCVVELNMNRANKALSFYQKMGMHIHSEGDFDIGHGYFMNDYILQRTL